MTDGRCTDCRKGHYAMPDGSVTNFPCTTEGCTCWYCGPMVMPAQDVARRLIGTLPDSPEFVAANLAAAEVAPVRRRRARLRWLKPWPVASIAGGDRCAQ